jgi:hypothetical protein
VNIPARIWAVEVKSMEGSTFVVLALGGAVVIAVAALVYNRLGGASLGSYLARAKETGDVAALVSWIERQPEQRCLDGFNQVIRRLWDDYEREAAMKVIRVLGERHSEERIAQYWLDQAHRVEPEIAQRILDRAFMVQHFKPELAAKCGRFG